jgi:nucleotide-binding universal stress UspA family protein
VLGERSRILIAIDGREQGADALELGRVMCVALGGRPTLATVLRWPADLPAPDDDTPAHHDARRLLLAAGERLAELGPETHLLVGSSVPEALYELAEAEQVGLIVVGSSHRGPLGRVVPGSVGTALLHGAPCGVLVANRGYAKSATEPRTLAAGFDGSKESWAALETAGALAERWNGTLTILTVAEIPRFRTATAMSVLTASEYRDYEREEKQRLLALALEGFGGRASVIGRLLVGAAGPLLKEAAADYDLLVLGSRGYGPLKRVFLGSASSAVVDSAPCPVLVVPRSADASPARLAA